MGGFQRVSGAEESLLERGLELIRASGNRGVCLRLVGSAAVAVRCEQVARETGVPVPVPRDLDFACPRGDAIALGGVLTEHGYRQDRGLLVATEGRRWTLTSQNRSHSIDVFFDELEFSHRLDLRGRFFLDPVTLSPADLLLAKLQYIDPQPRDMTALVLLLAAHAVANGDGERIDSRRVVDVLAASWGYYHTASTNLMRVSEAARDILSGSVTLAELVRKRGLALLREVEVAPKPLSWRLRRIIGTRVKWYNDVEMGEVF